MRLVFGLATVAAGAAAMTVWLSASDTDSKLAVVAGIGNGGVARLSVPQQATGSARDAGAAEPSVASRFFGAALPVKSVARVEPGLQAKAAEPASNTWSTDVVVYPDAQSGPKGTSVVPPVKVLISTPTPIPAIAPPRDRPRQELVRELQRELKRVGCHAGDVDGEWGPGSRRSMRSFMEQVNSRQQSDDPDLIQLTLVRGYPGTACRGAPGQMMAGRQQPAVPSVAVPAPSLVATGAFVEAPLPAPRRSKAAWQSAVPRWTRRRSHRQDRFRARRRQLARCGRAHGRPPAPRREARRERTWTE